MSEIKIFLISKKALELLYRIENLLIELNSLENEEDVEYDLLLLIGERKEFVLKGDLFNKEGLEL
jgi:hypothetical protein